jgi:hypothetical protein
VDHIPPRRHPTRRQNDQTQGVGLVLVSLVYSEFIIQDTPKGFRISEELNLFVRVITSKGARESSKGGSQCKVAEATLVRSGHRFEFQHIIRVFAVKVQRDVPSTGPSFFVLPSARELVHAPVLSLTPLRTVADVATNANTHPYSRTWLGSLTNVTGLRHHFSVAAELDREMGQ